MTGGAMAWQQQDERTSTMELSPGGADWIEVRRDDSRALPSWHVDGRLGGSHYKMSDPFATRAAAQGSALLLAMRLLPASRSALEAQLDLVPGAWWWKILPVGDATAEHGSIFSSRAMGSEQAAERSGRAAGAGCWLYVHGPGCVRAHGRLAR